VSYVIRESDFCDFDYLFRSTAYRTCRRAHQRIDLKTDSQPSNNFRKSAMKVTEKQNEKIAKMTFASVYPHYVTKVESKGRTRDELHQVIEWLTGFNEQKLQELIERKATFEEFFAEANLHPNAQMITGIICGYRIEEIEFPLTRQAR